MKATLKQRGRTGLVLAGLLMVWPASGVATEPFAVYEDWTTSPTMRSDRWLAVDTGTLEVKREVKGHTLLMRSRREGGTASDAGFTGARQRLVFTHPVAIDQIATTLDMAALAVLGCATNPTQPSLAYAAITLNRFNDGSGGSGNMTGDHLLSVNVYRDSNSVDPEGVLRFRGVILRCVDAGCSNAFSIPGGVVDLPATVLVGQRFTMRVVWDAANSRVLVGVGDDPDVAIAYPPESNQRPAGVPFADIRTQLVAANCTSGSTVTDTTVAIRDVQTNASAIIP